MSDRHPAEEDEPGPGVAVQRRQADPAGAEDEASAGAGEPVDPVGGTVADAIRSAMNRRA
ncbi:hypothetical protein [Amycolatopsis jiangsuensis]|uniref:Uncharacterized protein n=1 Tax=Amycolatopsis jiangsuensis TaxID=1181879 RepID=A0A840IW65_9PSEU|nr:hypothetical protein [Amycolatopsis jiangsuensis]MBB4685398.1 hypothetical protein [Amycolatopsis jiangsuensis]